MLLYAKKQYSYLLCSIVFVEVRVLKPYKKKVSITLDEDLIEKIKLLAEDCERSFSQYINMALRDHVQEKLGK